MQLATSGPVVAPTVDSLRVTFAPLSLDEVYTLADDPANGAVVVMSGMVRNNSEGKAVVALEYQAYEPMALEVFKQMPPKFASLGQRPPAW
jgi:molybdopterin synthase catalytic subunit